MCRRLNLKTTEESLIEVRDNFDYINQRIKTQRDKFTNQVMWNLLETYDYLNYLLTRDIDLFDGCHNNEILEMNHLVLMGSDTKIRQEYHPHIEATQEKFYKGIQKVLSHTQFKDGIKQISHKKKFKTFLEQYISERYSEKVKS